MTTSHSFNNAQYPSADGPSFMNPAAKTRMAAFFDWFLGANRDDLADQGALRTPPPLNGPEVTVLPPASSSSIDCFQNVLTEATTQLASRYAILHRLDPRNAFTVREVNIDLTGAPDQLVSDIGDLPPDVRNRAILLIMEAAPSAKDLLLFNDYFGSTLVTNITVVKGQPVQRMAAYAGCRFEVKFKFDGGVTTRPLAPAQPVPAHQHSEKPACSEVQCSQPQPEPETIYMPLPTAGLDAHPDENPGGIQHTILRTDAPTLPSGQHTALNCTQAAAAPGIGTLHLRSLEHQAHITLLADNFPYTLGRHDSFKGYSVQGRCDAQATQLLSLEPAGFKSFASRGHLVLDSFDPSTQQFCVVATNGKNGTYFKAAKMPERFLLPLAVMANGDWLKLGGNSGDNILEIRIEAT
ncbi:MAG: hypothetical protein H7293_02800 [Candidatus Saccharibacteria bacterium]|nr:hypothetical protein [Rhodoferax sp.]